jgi:hypothetical protein
MMYHNSRATDTPITIRAAVPGDDRALRRLAQRDTRSLPEGDLLVAAVDGELRAAISLASGEATADPFHRTQELVRLLILRRAQLGVGPRRSRAARSLRGARPRLGEAAERESPALAP